MKTSPLPPVASPESKTLFRAKARARHHLVEPLEDRIAPAAVSWDGGGDGVNWNSKNNWSNDLVPTVDDIVTIKPAGQLTITINSGAQTVASLSMDDDALSITGGSLTIASGNSTINNLTLAGTGTLTTNAATSLTGTNSFGGGGKLEGSAAVTLTAGATLNFTDNSPTLSTELVNAGTINQNSASPILDGASAKLRIVSGGLFDAKIAGGTALRGTNSPLGVFVEAGGTFRHSATTAGAFIVDSGLPLNVNGGTVEATGNNVALLLASAGTFQNATFTAVANTSIQFQGQNNTIVGTATGGGAGSLYLGATNAELRADASGAVLNFSPGFFSLGGSGSLSGPGVFTNTGAIQIADGSPKLRTELVNAGTITQGSASFGLDGASAKLRIVSGGLYDSKIAGGFEMQGTNNPLGVFVEAGGTFRHSPTSGGAFFVNSGLPFKVTGGTVEAKAGTGAALIFRGPSTFQNTTFTAVANSSIQFEGPDNTIVGTATGGGAGSLYLGAFNAELRADTSGAVLNFPTGFFNIGGSGSLSGPGVFTNTGAIQISDNSPKLRTELVNAGTITHGSASFVLDGASAKLRIVNGGLYDVKIGGSFELQATNNPLGVFVEAGGTFRHSGNGGVFFVRPSFSNLGTVVESGVSGSGLFITGQVSNLVGNTLTGGSWEVGNSTALRFGSGTPVTTNAANITVRGSGNFVGLDALVTNSGSLSLLDGADLSVTGNLSNAGALTLSAGSVLTVPGTFAQTAAGSISFGVAGANAGQAGKLAVTGAVTLAGRADIQLASNFAPAAGANIQLATFPSKTGDFSSVTGLGLGRVRLFEVVTNATEVKLNSLAAAANLATQTVSTPGNTSAGSDITVSYSVKNVSGNATVANTWTDTIYLSKDGVLDARDIVLTRVTHSGVVAADATYSESVTVPLLGAIDGDYRILVVADSQGRVPDPDRADNLGASAGTFALTVPTLTPGVAFNGTIKSGQDLYFKVTLGAGQTPSFNLTGAVAGAAELYQSFGAVPTRGAFDASAFALGSTLQRIVGEASAAGTYYVLVHGREAAGSAGQNFTLTVNGLGFDIIDLDLKQGPNIGKVTTTLSGSQFTQGTTFILKQGATTRAATATYFTDAKTVSATFDLTGLAAGAYDVVATNGAATDTLAGGFTVSNGGTPGTLQWSFDTPRYIRPPFSGAAATITYRNTGSTDLDAPLFTLFATNARLRLADQVGFVNGTYTSTGGQLVGAFELLGTSGGLGGVLSPGETGTITVFFEPVDSTAHAFSRFEVDLAQPATSALNWDLLKDDLKPVGVPSDAWDAVFTNFKTGVGSTFTSYKAALVENANYLSQFGPVSPDATRLVSFELEQAGDFGAIAERYTLEAFGRGRTAPFSEHIEQDEFGNVLIVKGQSSQGFVKLADGTYRGTGLELSTLTRSSGGGFTLDDGAGTRKVFRANDGRLDYIEDLNGRRFTAAWNNAGQLLSVTDNRTGDTITYTHNAQGRIATETDPVGRVTTYTYDTSGEHLTGVATAAGTTTFTYTPTGHAVASVTRPDGVVTSFTYDTAGRVLTQTTGSGPGAVTLNYSYTGPGVVTLTDANGDSAQIFRTPDGSLGRVVAENGSTTNVKFDALGRIASVTDATGLAAKASYSGGTTSFTGGDRAATLLDLGGDVRRLQSITDAGGDVTKLGYDAKGNLISTLLPDGFGSSYEYNAAGQLTAATNENGERVTFTYDSKGLLTARTLPGGETVAFTYDNHRNLLTATDADGTTTFTYDSADRITGASYPNGKAITLTYDSAGRRATIADQSGYTVRYSYDALGRLDVVRDTGNQLLVDYDYDTQNQLTTETRGNGTSTTYSYTAAGTIAQVTHRSGATIVERLDYTRDALGRVTTMTNLAGGVTSYTYDAAGQLKTTVLPGGRSFTFTYDAEGNRTAVVDSLTGTANYTTNSGDQYTTAGNETLTYDRAGRLIASTAAGVTTSYGYDLSGHLVSVTKPGSVITYDYDALGQRIGRVENGVRTDFAIDPAGLGTVFGEYQGATNVNYASGLGVAARATAGSTNFYHFDALGNTTLLTGSGGATTASYTYLPFGEIATQSGASAQPFTFGGRAGVQDDAGDLFQMRARTYDAGLGRFVSRDPIGFSGGDPNLYRFANNDPANFNDPSGKTFTSYGFGIVGTTADGTAIFGEVAGTRALAQAATRYVNGAVNPFFSGFATTASETTTAIAVAEAPIAVGPIGGTLIADTNAALAAYSSTTSSAAGLSAELSGLGTVGATGAAGLLGAGMIAAGVGGATGYLIDEVTEATHPAAKQQFREDLANGFGLKSDPSRPLNEDLSYVDKDYNRFVKNSGNSHLLRDYYKIYIQAGLSPEDALLKARTKLRDYENDKYRPGTAGGGSEVIRPNDPNNIIGPAGAGADFIPDEIVPTQQRFDGFVSAAGSYPFKIEFENKASASAPAQVVTVTQTLDAGLDLATFAFTGFGFGKERVPVPASTNGTSFQTIYDATAALGVKVKIDAQLNTTTRVLTITYTSLDPVTNDVPTDPFAGFLPPNDSSGRGDGFVTYAVKAKAGLATGTDFVSRASIVFDTEDAILTPRVTNTLDTVAPTSQITPFAAATSTRPAFAVRWTGSDEGGGSGLAGISLYYSDNGGPLQTASVVNAAGGFRFEGEVGHTYAFFSAATDNVGNTEAVAGTPDATITVVAPTLITATRNTATLTDTDGDIYTIKLTGPGTLQYATVDPDGAGPLNGPLDFVVLDGTTDKSSFSVTVKRKGDGPDLDRLPDGDGIVAIGDVTIAGALGSFTATASDFIANGLTATGAVKRVAVRDALQPDVFAADPLIQTGAAAKVALSVAARNLADGFRITTTGALGTISAGSIGDGDIQGTTLNSLKTTAGEMDADLLITGATGAITVKKGANAGTWSAASFGAIKLGGALAADVTATSTTLGVGAITVTGGGISGDLSARSFGAIKISGGNFAGTLTSTTTAAALGKTAALAGLSVVGGDFTGDLSVLGNLGAFAVKNDRKLGGGNVTGASVTAAKIASILVGKDLSQSLLLAGASLGSDFAFGGTGFAADVFAAGSIGSVTVSGTVVASTIAAGLSNPNGTIKDSDDTILGGTPSRIAKLIVKGTVDAASYFAAGTIGGKPSIGGVVIANPAGDARFKIG